MKIHKLMTMLLLIISQVSIAESTQPLQSISDAVMTYVKSSLEANGKHEIEVSQLDSRLQLPLCDNPLQVYPQAGEIKAGRNTIAVRCTGSQNWMIYTSVSIKSYKEVVLLTKALRRGDVIRAEDLVSEPRDISKLTQGYIIDPADVINKQAARNLSIGSALNRLSYQALTLVKRGERVNIQTGNTGISITSTGFALADGGKGDRINVKNISSQRIIQAVVIDAGQVSVNF